MSVFTLGKQSVRDTKMHLPDPLPWRTYCPAKRRELPLLLQRFPQVPRAALLKGLIGQDGV